MNIEELIEKYDRLLIPNGGTIRDFAAELLEMVESNAESLGERGLYCDYSGAIDNALEQLKR